jgi:hypothetical protein
LAGKYPEYLETHASTLSAEDTTKYTEQAKVIKLICATYEDDSLPSKQQVSKVMELMEQMQSYVADPPPPLSLSLSLYLSHHHRHHPDIVKSGNIFSFSLSLSLSLPPPLPPLHVVGMERRQPRSSLLTLPPSMW